jgi:hypothetical protein
MPDEMSRSLRGVLWRVIQESLEESRGPSFQKKPDGTLVACSPLAREGVPASRLRDVLVRHATGGEYRPTSAVQLLWRMGHDPVVRLDEGVRLEVRFANGDVVTVPCKIWVPPGSLPWDEITAHRLPEADGANAVAHFTGLADGAHWRYFHNFLPLITERPDLRHPWGMRIRNEPALRDRLRKQTTSAPDDRNIGEWFELLIGSCLIVVLDEHRGLISIKGGPQKIGEWTREGVEKGEVYGTGIHGRRAKTSIQPIEGEVADTNDSFGEVEDRIDGEEALQKLADKVRELTPREKDVLRAVMDTFEGTEPNYYAAAARLGITPQRVHSYMSVVRKKASPYRELIG